MASARQRGGKWTGLYRGADGKQKSAGTFDSADEALARATVAEIDAKQAKALANPPPPVMLYPDTKRGAVTVAAFAARWLDGLLVEPNTRLAYGLSVKHIVKCIGTKSVAEVSPDDIRGILAYLKKLGRADNTIRHTLVVSRQMFQAASPEFRKDDPCSGIKFKVKDERETMTATPEQARAIEAAAPEPYRLLIRVLFHTGARWGEAIGIKGSDVEQSPSGHLLRIRRTVGDTAGVGLYLRNHGKSVHAKRSIPIPKPLAQELAMYGNDFCFLASNGSFLRRSDFRRQIWAPATKAVGISGLTIHDARRSHATWLANDPNVPLAHLKVRLGHASLGVLSKYVVVKPTADDPCLVALMKSIS